MRLKDFAAYDIAPETLARLVREAVVVRPARGLYQLSDAPAGLNHTLAEAGTLVPKGIICLTSALQYHGLTLQLPSAVWVAISRSAWRPKIDYPSIRIVRFSGNDLTAGIVIVPIEGVPVSITNVTRTIVDCFRYRNKVGIDVAMEGLRESLKQKKTTVDALYRAATEGRVWSVMRPYVEAMVSDGA